MNPTDRALLCPQFGSAILAFGFLPRLNFIETFSCASISVSVFPQRIIQTSLDNPKRHHDLVPPGVNPEGITRESHGCLFRGGLLSELSEKNRVLIDKQRLEQSPKKVLLPTISLQPDTLSPARAPDAVSGLFNIKTS